MRLSFATQDRRPRRERIHDRMVGSAKKDPTWRWTGTAIDCGAM
jgi:hypothetical protein